MPPVISPDSLAIVGGLEKHSGYYKPRVDFERIQLVTEQLNGLLAADLLQMQPEVQPGTLQFPTFGCASPTRNLSPDHVAHLERLGMPSDLGQGRKRREQARIYRRPALR
jgi:hypothetical protein